MVLRYREGTPARGFSYVWPTIPARCALSRAPHRPRRPHVSRGGGHPPGYVYVFERLKIPADHEGVLEHLARAAAYFEGQPDKDVDTYLAKVRCLAEHWAVWCEPGEVVPFFRRLAACKNAKVREMAGPRLMVLGTDAEWKAGVARHRTDEQKRTLLTWVARHTPERGRRHLPAHHGELT